MTSRRRPVAHRGAGQGAGGNGLLGALGVGAIAGAVLLPRLRTRLSTNALLVAAGGAYAAALLAGADAQRGRDPGRVAPGGERGRDP